MNLPKMNCNVLINALLQITIDTDDTTDRLSAPIVPNWNFSLSPILFFVVLNKNKKKINKNIHKSNKVTKFSKHQTIKKEI